MNASSPFLTATTTDLRHPFTEIARFAIHRSTPDTGFYMRNINITDCSIFLTVYEYSRANANGSDFSFMNRQEVDFGRENPWTLGHSPVGNMFTPIYVSETTAGKSYVPALEIKFADLLAVGNFFESPMVINEWAKGSFVNTNLGVAAGLMGDVDLDDRINGMASAMTEYLRYGPNSQLAGGEIVHSEAYISIRWGYFIVPILTEALAIVFAILSI